MLLVEKKNKKSLKVSKGKIRLPVRGEIISNYGEGRDSRNSKDGLVFKVFKESFVTSPINGMVVYANQFRSYGNLIIIESTSGVTIGPPADNEYAVDPVGVETITPSAL